jgi:hypothetical protein
MVKNSTGHEAPAKLRRIFPLWTLCPACAYPGFIRISRGGGDVEYRMCDSCSRTYKVTPLAIEINVDGQSVDGQSVIEICHNGKVVASDPGGQARLSGDPHP